jgi:predicted dehydrogenase
LIDLARAKGVVLQVGHIERFNAAIIKLREILTAPRFVECHRLGPFDPRIGDVGVVLDLMIHDLDIILNVVQSPIVSIESVGVPILTDNEDIANARIRFQNGCIANLTASRVTPVKKRKIRIFQDDAYIAINYDRQSMEIYRRVEPKDKSKGAKAEIVRKRLKLKLEDKLELELDHFLSCVIEGALPLVTGEQATEALDAAVRISEQIRSVANGYFHKQP